MDGSRRPDAGGAPTAQVRPDPAAVAVRGAGTRTGTVPVPVPVRGGGAPRGDRRCVGTAGNLQPERPPALTFPIIICIIVQVQVTTNMCICVTRWPRPSLAGRV